MSLNFGREQVLIPGPSVVPDRVLRAMHRASPNIYEGDLISLANSLYPDLNKIAKNSGDVAIYIGNGHAAWESSLTNTLSRGDTVLVLISGRFGRGWMDMAKFLGVNVTSLDFGADQPADPDRVKAVLASDADHKIKAVLTVQTDTASSVTNDIQALRSILDEVEHPALLMVDCMASLGCEPFDMDAWEVDVMLAGCQKGLMTPAGVAFTFIRGEKVWAAYEQASLKTPYWDWHRRLHGEFFHQKFCGTPPSHHLYGLREALDILIEEGIENSWHRHQVMASAVWAAVERWGAVSGHLACNVQAIPHRSLAVTTIKTAEGDGNRIRRWCEDNAGLTLGVGLDLESTLGGQSASHFRVGHMGHLNPPMLLGALATVDAALKALGIDHGTGALDAASAVIAAG